MSEEERLEIVRGIAVACMWGHGGIGSVILEELDKRLPAEPTWTALHRENAKSAKRERMGVLDDERRLSSYLRSGYWLTNYDEDGCSLFNPPPMNGLAMYVSRRLARLYPHLDINRAINEKRGLYEPEP